MALFCFWTRRACSRYAVLGQPLPPGSKLETHIANCSDCREYWDDMRMLTSDLDRMITVPHPSAGFAEPIWERVKPTKRAFQWGTVSLAAAAACGLVCGLVWWRFASHQPEMTPYHEVVKNPPKPHVDDPIAPIVAPEIGPLPIHENAANRMAQAPAHHYRHPLKWANVRGASQTGRLASRTQRRLSELANLRRSDSAAQLRASGLMYEAQGDPGLANVAYQAAYQQHPSEDTAFDMGRSAEESGDMEQAMNVYAGLLESAGARTQAQKGWTP